MHKPIVSVIMNCYNSAKYLREALDNVLAQTYQNWELIFWDNQSIDQSADIFKSYHDPRFHYYRAEEHSTLGKARNYAVAKAAGTWLAFLDCDDVWTVDKLHKQIQAIEKNSNDNIGFVYNPVKIFSTANTKNATFLEKYYNRLKIVPHGARSIFVTLLKRNFIIFSTLLINRELFLNVGGIDDSLSQNEDYDLLLKASRVANAICIEDVCTMYRIHDSNTSHSESGLNFIENIRIFAALPQDRFVKKARKVNASRYAVFQISRGDIRAGIRLLLSEGSPLWVLRQIFVRIIEKIQQR
jgi:glycosyltransferase involved in cell wall biosynthesis